MRKLLTILAAVGLTATASTLVVSCGTNVKRFNKLDFSNKNIYNMMLVKMKNDGLISKSQAEQFLKMSDEEILKDVMKLIDKSISELEFKETNKNISNALKVKENQKSEYTDLLIDNLATNKFFSEYTSKLIKNNGKINEMNDYGHIALNPYGLLKNDENVKYYVYFKETSDGDNYQRWSARYEFDKSGKYITPSLELLNSGKDNFIIVASDKLLGESISKPTNKITIGEEYTSGNVLIQESDSKTDFSGSEIMKYRFQRHINAKVKTELYTNLINLAYMDSNIISTGFSNKNYTNTKAMINTNNKLIKNMQNEIESTSKNQQSNIKMIWSIKTVDSQNTIINLIQSLKNELGIIADTEGNFLLKEDSLSKLSLENIQSHNKSELGSDALFNIKGYDGIAKNSESGIAALSGELTISTEAQTAAKNVTRPTILTNKGNGFTVDRETQREIVIVLPVYLNDIYSPEGVTLSTIDKKANIQLPASTWLPLGDKYLQNGNGSTEIKPNSNIDVIQDTKNNYYIKLTDSTKDGSFEMGGQEINVKHVSDEEFSVIGINQEINKEDNSFKNSFIDSNKEKVKDGDKILHSINLSRTNDSKLYFNFVNNWNSQEQSSAEVRKLSVNKKMLLLDEIKNGLVTSDEDYTTEAKTSLYSKYIMEGDSVLYQGLYDQISKYIKEDESNTSD